ncbi:hypothetical protein EG68_00012 [Paragonimus skrjabini miyazakii]|uniref:Acyltransferase n=1 Tax=Paragonimus skrjabini miyazakii TaxID=59628 RepID=A0A8S9Z5I0_9TREM|nr:hypothetical protein EG68_00012 [Paragonimus skrjabini miyazakii]
MCESPTKEPTTLKPDINSAAVSSASFPAGLVVKPRPTGPKSYVVRSLEFTAVCYWVTGFLFLGISCLIVFLFLLCAIIKHISFLVMFTVGIPERDGKVQIDSEQYLLETVYTTILLLFVTSYLYYWHFDAGAEDRGSHPWRRIRYWGLWNRMANYFPVNLVLSEELLNSDHIVCVSHGQNLQNSSFGGLPKNMNYLVGYHPHGVFSTGAFVNFMTEATGFSIAFPGLTPWLAVLKAHFKSPFYRDYLMSFGITAATKKGLLYLLEAKKNGTGNFVVVVVGGAPEALEAQPGQYRMVIHKRYGFFKLAVQTGCCLIPCVSFGEQRMYKQVPNEPGSWIRRFQDWVTQLSTFAPPLFYARGPFPYRTPVNTVVGAPIPCEKIPEPTYDQVMQVKWQYLESLQRLFRRYKAVYDPDAHDIEFI